MYTKRVRCSVWIVWIVVAIVVQVLPMSNLLKNSLCIVNTYIAFRMLRPTDRFYLVLEISIVVGAIVLRYLLAKECVLCFDHAKYWWFADVSALLYNTYRNYKIGLRDCRL